MTSLPRTASAVTLPPPPPLHRNWRALGHGVIAWVLATWMMLTAGGLFDWRAGMAMRYLAIPAAFGLLARIHARPGNLSRMQTAGWFVIVGLTLDAVLLVTMLGMSPPWLPYVLGFAAAAWAGRHVPRLAYA